MSFHRKTYKCAEYKQPYKAGYKKQGQKTHYSISKSPKGYTSNGFKVLIPYGHKDFNKTVFFGGVIYRFLDPLRIYILIISVSKL